MVYIPWLMKQQGLKPTVQFFDSGVIWVDKSNVDTYQEDQRGAFQTLKEYVETEVMK